MAAAAPAGPPLRAVPAPLARHWCMPCLQRSTRAPVNATVAFDIGCRLTVQDSVLCSRCHASRGLCVEPKAAMTGDARDLSTLIRWVATFWDPWPDHAAGWTYPVWNAICRTALNAALRNLATAFNSAHVKHVGAFKVGNTGNKYFHEAEYQDFIHMRRQSTINPVPRPRISAPAADWNAFNDEDALRLRPRDIGFIHWTQAKHDLLRAVKAAADGCCGRMFGVAGVPGNTLAPTSAGGTTNHHENLMAKIDADFPVSLPDL